MGGVRTSVPRSALYAVVGAAVLSSVASAALTLPAWASMSATPSVTSMTSATVSPSVTAIGSAPSETPTPTGTLLTAGLEVIPTEATALARYREEVRRRVVLATEQRKAATAAVDAANAAASQAIEHAMDSGRRAADARDRLAMWTSYLYRVSGNSGLLLSIFNNPSEDPMDFLRGADDASVFSQEFLFDVQVAYDSAVEATRAAAEAIKLNDVAQDRAADTETIRQALVALLGKAQAQVPVTPPELKQGKTVAQTLIDGRACPSAAPANTLRDGSDSVGILKLCQQAVKEAATPQAALAIQAGFQMLGAPYACGGIGRQDPFKFDCSSLVSRAYYLGAGIDTAGSTWAPSTRDMVPWDGVPLAWWASYVDPQFIRPGDLVLYDTGGAAYRHVVLYLGNGYMLHTNSCGDVAHVSSFWGTGNDHATFLVVRRVIAPGGYRVPDPHPIPTGGGKPAPKPDPGAGDPKVVVPTPVPTPTPTPTLTPTPTAAPTGDPSTSPSSTPTGTTTGDPSSSASDSPSDSSSSGSSSSSSGSSSESGAPTDTMTSSPSDFPSSTDPTTAPYWP